MSFRTTGIAALSAVLNNQKNINIIERAVFTQTSENEDEYKIIIYQAISDIQSGTTIKETFRRIKSGEVGWKHHSYTVMAQRINEQNDFIENPFEVEEGVHQCRGCGSKRVFSYSKQVRSSDEGTSVFCECVACHIKWKESG